MKFRVSKIVENILEPLGCYANTRLMSSVIENLCYLFKDLTSITAYNFLTLRRLLTEVRTMFGTYLSVRQ